MRHRAAIVAFFSISSISGWQALGQGCEPHLYDYLTTGNTWSKPYRYDGFHAAPTWYLSREVDDDTSFWQPVTWNGTELAPLVLPLWIDPKLGFKFDPYVRAYRVVDFGQGPAMYIGGGFTHASGKLCDGLVRWDGKDSFEPVGTFAAVGTFFATTWILRDFDLGGGTNLLTCGSFTQVDGVPGTQGIARYDGVAWHSLGGIGVSDFVLDVEEYDDGAGSGPALYAGGYFTAFPGSAIARWTLSGWSSMGVLIGLDGGPKVRDLQLFDDGVTGPSLYAAGCFASTNAVPGTKSIARWNANGWSSVGGGLGPGNNNQCLTSLAVFDDGVGGEKLYASGVFLQIGGKSLSSVVRWNGETWEALPGGFDFHGSQSLGVMPFEGQDRLWYLGTDHGPGKYGFIGLMHYYRDCTPCPADCDHNDVYDINDFICFQTQFAVGNMSADCDQSGSLDIDDFICFQVAYAIGC